MFISERRRRRRGPLVVAIVLLAVAGAALAAFLILSNRTDDVRRGDEVEFRAPPPPPPKDDAVDWPVYHYDTSHTGYLRARVAPPFKERWVFSGNVLMEFPPIVVDGSVYFMRNNGGTYRLDADTGKVKWKNQIGKLSASSPAYSDGRLFVTSLAGKITALRARSGKLLWQKQLGSRTESSPIVRRGIVYFGTEGGDLYALFAKTGRVKWKFNASGAIKASPALSGSTLYVGRLQRADVRGLGEDGTRALVDRHVRLPVRVRGRELLLDARGRLRPRLRRQHRRQGVLVRRAGRHARLVQLDRRLRLLLSRRRERAGHQADRLHRLLRRQHVRARRAHRLHALDRARRRAASRAARPWSAASSTSPTSTRRRPTASTPATAKLVFKRSRGYYNPVVSDGKRLYMTGYASVTALDPVKKRRRARR